jgi:hypothetical protein
MSEHEVEQGQHFSHRYVGNHPQEVVVNGNALMLSPGEFVNLTDDDLETEHNKWLLDSRLMLDLSTMKDTEGGENK